MRHQLNVRIPQPLWEEVRRFAEEHNLSQSDVVIAALHRFFAAVAAADALAAHVRAERPKRERRRS